MLEHVDVTQKLAKETFRAGLPALRKRLAEVTRAAHDQRIPAIVIFEGWGCSGKGAAIQLLTERLDARGFKVHAIGRPTTEERSRPWMYRFWLRLPRRGELVIFDRSWYGKVLRERVDRVIPAAEARASLQEIRELESALVHDGVLLVKFWMHISRKEQARRLEKLSNDPLHKYLVDAHDWAENDSYRRHEKAVERMLAETSTSLAPWTLVEANDRRFAFQRVYDTLIGAYERTLGARIAL